jgi:hypothetical protein
MAPQIQRFHLASAKPLAALPVLLLALLLPQVALAQELGRVECARASGYVYLYSSMITLDVRATLQCGEQVEITGRYDTYYGVRTTKGDTGYVPLDSLFLLKTAPGAKPAVAPTTGAPKDKTFYDVTRGGADAPAASGAAPTLALLDGTPILMKLGKAVSSADAHVGDEVHFEVSEDVLVDGLLVVPKGALASGVVNDAEPKKAMGRGGKLSILIQKVRLADNETAGLRSDTGRKGASSTAGAVIPVMRGKDITFPQGMEFTAYVNGDTHLKRESFHGASETASAPAASTNPPQ